MVTTMKVAEKTKAELNEFREYKSESYDEILRKLIYIAQTAKLEPHLSKKAIQEIEAARKRIQSGSYYSEKEVKEMLGL